MNRQEYRNQCKSEAIKRSGRTCKQCGSVFIRRNGGNTTSGSGSFCSRKCWGIWRRAQDTQSSKINGYYPGAKCRLYFKNCEYCSLLYTSRYKTKRSFCCSEHRSEQSKKDYYDNRDDILKRIRDEYEPKPKTIQTCNQCGSQFDGHNGNAYCSNICRKKAKQGRKAKRRAARAGVYYEPVDPIKVFNRDGWRCQLCGKKLNNKHRGTFRDDAPEIDHIIPWAQGGEHSYRNTQCACRKCNEAKGANERGQLKMFG